MSTSWSLTTYGWMTWADARSLCGKGQALWLGSTAVQEGPLPPELPYTSRLHVWQDDALWRLIPDHARGLVQVACLAEESRPQSEVRSGAGANTSLDRRAVHPSISSSDGWERLTIRESGAITFLRRAAESTTTRPGPNDQGE